MQLMMYPSAKSLNKDSGNNVQTTHWNKPQTSQLTTNPSCVTNPLSNFLDKLKSPKSPESKAATQQVPHVT